jgi:hypothetical protein
MKYIVAPTLDAKKATHQDASNVLYVITEVEDDIVLRSKTAIVATDISSYTELQTYVAKKASELEKAKKEAIATLNNRLRNKLNAGVTVGELDLAASESDIAAFAQGLVVLNTVESMGSVSAQDESAPTPVTGDTMISAVFGRGVIDKKGDHHDMSVTDYKKLALSYGMAIGQNQGETLAKIAQINAATTKEAVDALVVLPKVKKDKKDKVKKPE